MAINEKIKRQEQKVARLEKQLAQQKLKKRRADTRKKIELGGLVIKAKMHVFPKDVILGALIDALEQITRDESSKQLFQLKGQAAFMATKE